MLEMQERQFWSLGCDDPLEEGMATHSSILGGKIPRTEKPGGLWSTGSQVGHDWSGWAQHTHTHTHTHTPIRLPHIGFVLFPPWEAGCISVRWGNFIPELTQHQGDRCMSGVMPWDVQQSLQENLLGGERVVSNIRICALLQAAGVYWWAGAAQGLTVSLDEMFSESSAGWGFPLSFHRCQNCSAVWGLTPEYLPSLPETGWNLGPFAAVL